MTKSMCTPGHHTHTHAHMLNITFQIYSLCARCDNNPFQGGFPLELGAQL